MARHPYTPAKRDANKRYDAKTYRKVNIALRLDDDADIISSLDRAKERGLTNRDWLREHFKG
jgi:hypothetical protein